MNDDLRAAAQAATPLPHSNADQAIAFVQAREEFRQLASPDRILGILSELERKTGALEDVLDTFNRDNIRPGQAAFEMAATALAALEGKPTDG